MDAPRTLTLGMEGMTIKETKTESKTRVFNDSVGRSVWIWRVCSYHFSFRSVMRLPCDVIDTASFKFCTFALWNRSRVRDAGGIVTHLEQYGLGSKGLQFVICTGATGPAPAVFEALCFTACSFF